MNRKAQVTIFFAIGLVILIIFLLLLYIRSASSGPDERVENPLESPASKQYIQSCVDDAFYTGVETLGRQGGAFLDEERPEIDGKTYESITRTTSGSEQRTAISVAADGALTEAIYDDGTLVFGYQTLLDRIDENDHTYVSSLFGEITMPRLCAIDGPNKPDQSENIRCSNAAYNRPPTTSTATIQSALGRYITQEVAACVARSDDPDVNALGEPTTTVIFGSSETNIQLTFLNASIPGVISAPHLEQRYAVRLLSLYEYVLERLVENTRNALVPIRLPEGSQEGEHYQPGFSLSGPLPLGGYNLYTATDERSMVRGGHLSWSVVVEERDPFKDVGYVGGGIGGVCVDPDEGALVDC